MRKAYRLSIVRKEEASLKRRIVLMKMKNRIPFSWKKRNERS